MRSFSPKPRTLRALASAVALAVLLSTGLVPATGQAESRSSTVINGKRITVVGGSIQSINSTGQRTVVVLDGRRIVIRDGKITAGKKVHKVGHFSKIEINGRDGHLKIYVDGRLLK